MEYQSYSVRRLLDSVKSGGVRIPAFQRGFVWDMDRVAYLMDSIYKSYPFGSLLFWRTKNQLKVERRLGRFDLPAPVEDYPIDYVLDGQQRLTSIFTVFQNELNPVDDDNWVDIYFDMSVSGDAQESQFFPVLPCDFDPGRHFPLSVLFETVRYREATSIIPKDKVPLIDQLQEKFKEVSIPVQVLRTEERSTVGIVFERINRMGMELDTLQLLSAWTWNESFDLLESFKQLKSELEEFGFAAVGEDSDLVLRCAAAILRGEPVAESLLQLNGQTVRDEFPRVRNGIKGAIDFIKKQINVFSVKNLPYPALLIPLAVFFAEPDGKDVSYNGETYEKIKRWFWRSCFSNRYGSQTRKTSVRDIAEMSLLKEGKVNSLDEITCSVNASFFTERTFRIATANTKTFVLLLASMNPKSLLSGACIDLEPVLQGYNRSEFHHIYPRSVFKAEAEEVVNCLANFCLLSAAENRKIGRKKPSEYINDVATPKNDILGRVFCEVSDFDDNFESFISKRSERLANYANTLIA